MSDIHQYRKKPVVVSAIRYTGGEENTWEILEWGCEKFKLGKHREILIETLEGTMELVIGAYLIKGVADEFYPCASHIFEATYEPVEPGTVINKDYSS